MGRGGFTLVDMMVGVALMMTLALIATPPAATYFERYRFTAAAEHLVFEINRARMQAVAQNRFVRISLEDGQYVREESSDGIYFTRADEPVDLPPGVTLSAGPTGTPVFNRTGLATATTDLVIESSDQHKTIRTNIVGRVAML